MKDETTSPANLCVYTALLGGYERLNEQPTAPRSKVPFLCLTDDPKLRSDSWQTRLVTPLFEMDPVRSQRDLKLRPHLHLPEFDFSIYIDNAVLLTETPEKIFERYAAQPGFSLPRHSFRETVLDEFLEVAKRGFDDPSRVFEQLNHYSLLYPEVLEQAPYWGGILIRDHRDPEVRAMLDIWFAQVLRYSRRDQLSVNVAFRLAGLTPAVIDIDNWGSWFHSWPHTPGRNREKRTLSPAVSFSPPAARVRQLEQQLAEAERQREEMLSSDAWRVGRRVDAMAQRHPRLMGLARGAARKLARKRGG